MNCQKKTKKHANCCVIWSCNYVGKGWEGGAEQISSSLLRVPLSKRIPSVVIPLPVLVQGTQPRIPNVRGWLKKWQLPPHLRWPPPHFEKCLKGQSDICRGVLLTSSWLPSQCFATTPHRVSCPAVTFSLHQLLACFVGQTARRVWHSSFIDGLFINCSRGVVSLSALTLADPRGSSSSYWGPTPTESAGSFAIDLEWLWHAKK